MGMQKLPYDPSARRMFLHQAKQMVGKIQAPGGFKNGKAVKPKKFKEPWAYVKCDKTTLKKFASKYKWVASLLEYQGKMKVINTYLKGIGARVEYGVIHPSFLQTGTVTGRYSSKNPNFQNLPRDDKRVKNCFVARPGKVFVGADY
jgi:DNA polymerase I-like protein with 3'-5' exonuclease and polymerase domains